MDSQDNNNQNPKNIQGPQPDYYSPFNNGGHLTTPNSIGVLVLGILSIVFCWCYGVLSVVLGIVALVLASAGEKEYRLNPSAYSLTSYKNLKAGKTCAIIGLCLSGVAILCFIIYVIIVGSLAFNFLNLGLGN